MNVIHGLEHLPAGLRSGAVTIGNFDGVHRGHGRIMQRLQAAAHEVGGPAVVVTFDPHPARLLRPAECPLPLTWTTRKAELLGRLGVDAMAICATDRELLGWSPERFFAEIIRRRLDARAIVEGPNFFFGRDRAGTIDLLRTLSAKGGVDLEVVEPLELAGQVVSSSRIRRSIAQGDVQLACQMLTEPYRIRGMVTHGDARGAQIGFPTANLDAVDTLLPAAGVYAGRGYVADRLLPAAINIGPRPTFGSVLLRVEIHLIGFQGDLYGEPLEVDFLRRLRDIHCFDSVGALTVQLTQDAECARQVAAEYAAVPSGDGTTDV
jgi:riboflavin kinase / FMN adenylyltransferase